MTSLFPSQLRRLIGGERGASRGAREARVIAVCAQKGGVGKTTTAVNLAAGLAMLSDQRVLLVDMDGQGHCASALHAELRGVAAESLSGILLGRRRDIQEIALPTAIEGLWVCPSDKDLGAAEGVMAGKIGKEMLLRSAMKVARTHYDFIVIDCPPNLGNLTVNALLAADWLIVPCDMSMLSVEGVDDIFETVETVGDALGHHLSMLGVLRTRYDARNQKVNEAVEASLSRYARWVLPTVIPVNTTLAQAQLEGHPVFGFDPRCRGAQAYAELVEEVLVRTGAVTAAEVPAPL
ncbi:MAG: hypothetical protein CVU56_24190 [Deltaproteobacteria bacterium HGW-Deltaproteobacteria-14]|jgi:chromosome partitioning protein|nr:MAG: hypothetical protein CVU56_24190 [Deltaproteobacteria bacterium HGW-Deltaproteobacteria-14]